MRNSSSRRPRRTSSRCPSTVTRVVSIVPSLTESIAATHASLIVGATDYCTHPADLDVTRVRGTKNPDLDRIRELAPDVVLANAEENRAVDLDALRASGIAVWVTAPTTVDRITRLTDRMLSAIIGDVPAGCARRATCGVRRTTGMRRRAVIPIWRRPWMALGRDTFAGDLLAGSVSTTCCVNPVNVIRGSTRTCYPTTTSWCCRMSLMPFHRTTDRRHSRGRRSVCPGGISPGTDRRSSRRGRCSAGSCGDVRHDRCRLAGRLGMPHLHSLRAVDDREEEVLQG